MASATLKVVYLVGTAMIEDAKSRYENTQKRADETLESIMGRSADSGAWISCWREATWTDIDEKDAFVFSELIRNELQLPVMTEITTTAGMDDLPTRKAELYLTEKAVRMALAGADIFHSAVETGEDEPVSKDIHHFQPGTDSPPSDQFPS